MGSLGLQVFDGRPGFLGEVPHQALQDDPGDVLFKLGLIHRGTIDPVVAALPRPLDSLENADLLHRLEEVDDAGATDGLTLVPRINPIHDSLGAEAFGGGARKAV